MQGWVCFPSAPTSSLGWQCCPCQPWLHQTWRALGSGRPAPHLPPASGVANTLWRLIPSSGTLPIGASHLQVPNREHIHATNSCFFLFLEQSQLRLFGTCIHSSYTVLTKASMSIIFLCISSVTCICRPGWSESPSGKQLTADLKSKRSVASFGLHGEGCASTSGTCEPPIWLGSLEPTAGLRPPPLDLASL